MVKTPHSNNLYRGNTFTVYAYTCNRCACIHTPSRLMRPMPEFISCPVCGSAAKKNSYTLNKVEINSNHKKGSGKA